jgi:cyclophilin family peptidyl-prolyl cis-trans isomerase/HEAT repeat protein
MRSLLPLVCLAFFAATSFAQDRDAESASRRALLEGLDRRDPSVLGTLKAEDQSLLARRARYYLASDRDWAATFGPGAGAANLDLSAEAGWGFAHLWRAPVRAWELAPKEPDARRDLDAFRASARRALALPDANQDKRAGAASLRAAAAYGLMRSGGDEDRELAIRGLEDAVPQVAARMARLLGRIGDENSVGPLVAAVLNRKERSVRINALRALAARGDRAGVVAIAEALKSGDPHLQRCGLETLAAIAKKNQLEEAERRGLTAFVWALLTRDPNLDVRRSAVAPLALLSPKSLRLFLVRARQHEPWPLRAAAARALGEEKSLDWLWLDRFLADPDRRVAGAAVEAIAARAKSGDARARLWRVVEQATDDVQLELALRALSEELAPSAGPLSDARENLRARLWRATERVYAALPPSQAESKQVCLKSAALLDDSRSRDFLRRVANEDPEFAIRNFARRHLLELGVAPENLPALRLAGPHPESRRELAWEFLNRSEPLEAVITTGRGEIVFRLHGARAPFTCAVFVELARGGFYDGLLFHRVIPDFVAQAGCPRGDGWGGPGFSQRCEINGLSYRRGSVGMALAGQDTGGSQFFICFEDQPHLDGRYPIFGQVTEGFEVLDALSQGDCIETITIE